jgi:hypothetical protein
MKKKCYKRAKTKKPIVVELGAQKRICMNSKQNYYNIMKDTIAATCWLIVRSVNFLICNNSEVV